MDVCYVNFTKVQPFYIDNDNNNNNLNLLDVCRLNLKDGCHFYDSIQSRKFLP